MVPFKSADSTRLRRVILALLDAIFRVAVSRDGFVWSLWGATCFGASRLSRLVHAERSKMADRAGSSHYQSLAAANNAAEVNFGLKTLFKHRVAVSQDQADLPLLMQA